MITKDDELEIIRLLELKIADMTDKNSCQSIINKYINPGAKYCMTCQPAVQQMFRVLRNWWSEQTNK